MRRFTFLLLATTLFVGALTGCSSMPLVNRTPDLDNMTIHFQYATGMLDVTWYDKVERCLVRIDDGTFFSVDMSTKITILTRDGFHEAELVDLQGFDAKKGTVSGYFIKNDPYRLATNLVIDDLASTRPQAD